MFIFQRSQVLNRTVNAAEGSRRDRSHAGGVINRASRVAAARCNWHSTALY